MQEQFSTKRLDHLNILFNIVAILHDRPKYLWRMQSSIRFLEGRYRGFDPCLREVSIKSLLGCYILEHVLDKSWVEHLGSTFFHLEQFERSLGSKIEFVHGTRYPKFRIILCKGGLAQPSQQDKKVDNIFGLKFITQNHSFCMVI